MGPSSAGEWPRGRDVIVVETSSCGLIKEGGKALFGGSGSSNVNKTTQKEGRKEGRRTP